MKTNTLIKTIAAGLFAVSMANAGFSMGAAPVDSAAKAAEDSAAAALPKITMSELPNDSTIIEDDYSVRWLKIRLASFLEDERKFQNAYKEGYEYVRVYKTGPRTQVNDGKNTFDADPIAIVYKDPKKRAFYIPKAIGVLGRNDFNMLEYRTIATLDSTPDLWVTDWQDKPVKSVYDAVREALEKGPPPINKADLPKSKWKGPKIETQLKNLLKDRYSKIVKVIIKNDTWGYERSAFGTIISRWVEYDIVFEGKDKDGKKTFFYRNGWVAKQKHNGKDFDKTFVSTGVPVTDNRKIPDWK